MTTYTGDRRWANAEWRRINKVADPVAAEQSFYLGSDLELNITGATADDGGA